MRLWYDATDVPFLREDEKDAAEIASVTAQTVNSYITAGYEPDSVIAAVNANDLRLLKHSGYYSVQLQELGSAPASAVQARHVPSFRPKPLAIAPSDTEQEGVQ